MKPTKVTLHATIQTVDRQVNPDSTFASIPSDDLPRSSSSDVGDRHWQLSEAEFRRRIAQKLQQADACVAGIEDMLTDCLVDQPQPTVTRLREIFLDIQRLLKARDGAASASTSSTG